MLDRKEITYIMDMFRSTLQLPVETPDNPFIVPSTLEYIQPFMKIVVYQGDADKIFHVVINRIHLDYAALLWWDFPQLEEDYHYIKDDIPLVSVYTTGNVIVKGMLIPNELFTDEIRAIEEYKEYEKVFVSVGVPTIQPQPVKSTQRTIRIPSTHRTPTHTTIIDDVVQKKRKRKQIVGETSSPKPSLKIRVKQFKSSDTPIPPSSDDRERDEESYASEFVDSVFHDDDDSGYSQDVDNVFHDIIPTIASNATNDIIVDNLPKVLVEAVVKEKDMFQETVSALISKEFVDHAPKLIEELIHTSIQNNVITIHPTTSSSTATPSIVYLQHQLYLKMKRSLHDQVDDPQLLETVNKVDNTKDIIRFMLDRKEITYIMDMFRSTLQLPVETPDNPFIVPSTLEYIQPFMKIVVYQGDADKRLEEDYHYIKDDIPLVSVYTTGNVIVKGMLIPNELFTDEIRAIEEYKEYEKVFVSVGVPTIQPQPVKSTQRTIRIPSTHRTPTHTTIIDDVVQKKRKRKQIVGETSSPKPSLKIRVKQFKSSDTPIPPSSDDRERDEESYASEFVDSVFHDDDDSGYSQDVDNVFHDIIPTIASNATNDIIVDNLPKVLVEAVVKEKDMFQETVSALISKEFVDHAPKLIEELIHTSIQNNVITIHPTTSSSTATPSIVYLQHQLYLKMKRSLHDQVDDPQKVRANPEEYFSNHKIVEVVRVTTVQQHGLDFLEQIIVMRENDKPDSFSKADFKYLNKNDIEDLYYLCRNKKVDYRENKLMNSLMTFIKSRAIWERVHDFQLGIESYQIRVNLTAPTLIFHGIEARDPYYIVDKPSTGLIYLNSKEDKRVKYLVKIVKFCDAALERVLKEVKLKIFETEF
nr:hypothetical protein [Tanacetum cinerariifolium]